MKKIMSSILCVSLLASIICIPVSATEEVVVSESIEEFCEDVNEMINEYGGSEFVTPNFIVEEQTDENTDEELEIDYLPRLIVQSDKPINTYNAIDVVSGFSNFYIVQFENEQDTNFAHEQYINNPDIISVEYDISYNAFTYTTGNNTKKNTELTFEDYENGWYLNGTGLDYILNKYKKRELPDVVIAVIDTGVDLNNEYINDRIIPTKFNNSGEDDQASEQDFYGHGTMITSLIKNCTTENVKVANFRCGTSRGRITPTAACTAILSAVNFGVEIINCSFTINNTFALVQEAIDYAYKQSCALFAAAGNNTGDLELFSSPLTTSVICVGSSNKYYAPSSFTAWGKYCDILAPGEDMPLFDLNNEIVSTNGTSFSSPFMASLFAMHLSIYPTIPFKERIRIITSAGSGTDEDYVSEYFGSGIVNVPKLFSFNGLEEPQFNYSDGKYVGKVSLEITAEDDSDIYYTTDGTYPSKTNGKLYTETIELEDEWLTIRAIAYKNEQRSNLNTLDICSAVLGTDDMFTVNEDGVLTGYTGKVKYLKIPEVINGITVKEISYYSGFNTAEIYGVILPDTVEYLGWTIDKYDRPTVIDEQVGAFQENESIEFLIGKGIKVLGYYAVSHMSNIYEVDFPNCEVIMSQSFIDCGILGARFPKVKSIDNQAFYNNYRLREIYLPECISLGYGTFYQCLRLKEIYAPKADYLPLQEFEENGFTQDNPDATRMLFYDCSKLTNLDLPTIKTIGSNSFTQTALKELELSNIEYIYDLPDTILYKSESLGDASHYCSYFRPVSVELSLPSTLKYCIPATDYKNEFIEYVVYGTKGTYAESWATANDVQFVELTPETAVAEDVEPIWDEYSYKPLEFDARGFNRTYQWYGSNDNKQGNYDDKPITNATESIFNPNEHTAYQYYYCEMLSIDGDSKVTVKSSMCQNRLYHIFSINNTYIDYDNKLIYTKMTTSKDFSRILSIQENTSYSSLPSLVYKEYSWYGTGSEFVIFNGTKKERYTLIVEGDVDGDSAVDVLDAYQVSLVVNGHTELSDEYFLAADTNLDQEITVEDYSQVVNLALES